jgi:hypothetical protein
MGSTAHLVLRVAFDATGDVMVFSCRDVEKLEPDGLTKVGVGMTSLCPVLHVLLGQGCANCVVVAHVHCLHCLQVVCSTSLVPGDRIVVSPGTMSCDAVLLRGEAIVDENMLTGRSMQRQCIQHWLPAPVMGLPRSKS